MAASEVSSQRRFRSLLAFTPEEAIGLSFAGVLSSSAEAEDRRREELERARGRTTKHSLPPDDVQGCYCR